MSIVLNETDWARMMIRQRSLGKKPFETLRRVARYYLDNNYKRSDVRRMLTSFILQCDPMASVTKWSALIDGAINKALNKPPVQIENISITEPEMARIDALNGKQIKRLAFTLLCLAKYWDVANNTSSHWVNTKDSEIMHLSNINSSVKRQSIMYRMLNELGMVKFSKKVDNTNVQVCFIEDGEPVMEVTDFRNLGYQYMKRCGEPYFECKNCGITTKYNNPSSSGRKQLYCNSCATEIRARQNADSVTRIREKRRQQADANLQGTCSAI